MVARAFCRSASACSSAPWNSEGSSSAITWPFFTRELKSALSLEIVPETCDPTCTVVTALMVPVACTTSFMVPVCALAVKYCAWSLRPKVNAASRMTSPIAVSERSHLFLSSLIIILLSPNHLIPEIGRASCRERVYSSVGDGLLKGKGRGGGGRRCGVG